MTSIVFNAETLIRNAIIQNVKLMAAFHKAKKVSEDALIFYQENLEDAGLSLKEIVKPVAVTKEIHFEIINHTVVLNQKVALNNPHLINHIKDETKIILYGLTLSFDSRALLPSSNFDYALSQFQYILSKTMLLNMGNELFESCKKNYPEKKLMRFAIFQHDFEKNKADDKNLWSPQQIAILIPELNNENFPVTANENGCLDPLFSIVGIMTAHA